MLGEILVKTATPLQTAWNLEIVAIEVRYTVADVAE